MNRLAILACAGVAGAALAACGGGGSSSTPAAPAAIATPISIATNSSQQVVTMALPTTAINSETDPTYGLIGGYTQSQYSQVLGFVPGAKIMISNGELGVQHTLNVLSQTAFPTNPTLSTAAAGGSTLAAGFASGAVNGGSMVGPITLTAGVYYIGCAFHYVSNTMRDVMVVAANATPGVQAAPPAPTNTAPPSGFGY